MTEHTNLDVERAVNAAIIRDNAVLDTLLGAGLLAEHFYDAEMREVFTAACDLRQDGRLINPVTLLALAGTDPLGGQTVADRLRAVTFDGGAEPVPRDMTAALIDLAQRRELQALTQAVGASLADRTKKPATLAETLIRESERMLVKTMPAGQTYWQAPAAMREALAQLQRDNSADRIATGIADLDGMTGGVHRKLVTLLAARPSIGKSTVGTAVAMNAAMAGHGVLIVSLEMSLKQVEARIASAATYLRFGREDAIPYTGALNQTLNEYQIRQFVRAGMLVAGLPIAIDERPNQSVPEIVARVRKTAQEFKDKGKRLGLVIVDHLGKIRPRDPRAQVVNQIAQISNDLTVMGKSEDVAVLALHQLNRAVEGRKDKRPMLSDLRDSGHLEQDADDVLMIYRNSYYLRRPRNEDDAYEKDESLEAEAARLEQADREENLMEIIVAKSRNGRCGTVKAFCDMGCCIVSDLARENR
jgi:replicative DNA helicase